MSSQSCCCCCNQFDPSLGHLAESESSNKLREAGKMLKVDSDFQDVGNALKTILKVFYGNSPFCPVSIGTRRVCILFINWLHIIPLSNVEELGSLLLIHIARSEPRLAAVFFSEVFEMIRLIHDVRLLLDSPFQQMIEIFPRFVFATRRTLSSDDPKSTTNPSRGIVIGFQNNDGVSHALCNLSRIVCATNIKFDGIFLHELISVKLAMALLALGDSGQILASLLPFIRFHWVESHIEVWLQLGNEIGYLDWASAWFIESGLIPDPKPHDSQETQIVVGVDISSVEDRIAGVSLDALINAPVEIDAVRRAATIESVFETLTQFDCEGILNLLQNRLCPSQKDRSRSEVKIFQMLLYHQNLFRLFFPNPETPANRLVVALSVGLACSRTDMHALQFLAGKRISVPELVVQHLYVPVVILILSNLRGTNTNQFHTGVQFLTGTLFENKYSFSQLVEASGSDGVVFYLNQIVGISPDSPADFNEALVSAKKFIEYVSSCCVVSSAAAPAKRLKANHPHNEKELGFSATTGFLLENYLHFIQLVEDAVYAFPGKKLLVMSLLMSVVGEQVVKTYAIKTCEALLKLQLEESNFRSSHQKQAWTIFSSFLKQNDKLLLQLLPVIAENLLAVGATETADNLMSGVPKANRGLVNLMTGAGSETEIEVLESELRSDRTVAAKCSLLRFALSSFTVEQIAARKDTQIVRLVLDLVSGNLDNNSVLDACTNFLSKFGVFLGPGIPHFEHQYQDVCRMASWLNDPGQLVIFAMNVIQSFLIPKLKLDSHAFAVQEIISLMGAQSFVSSFPEESRSILTPYLTSSYRSTHCNEYPEQRNIDSLEDFFLFGISALGNNQPTIRGIFHSLRLAVANDSSLLSYVIPFLTEALGLGGDDTTRLSDKIASACVGLISVPIFSLENKINVKTVFGIIDHLSRLTAVNVSKRKQKDIDEFFASFFSQLPLDLLTTAAVAVEDFPRALIYWEKLLATIPANDRTEFHVIQLAQIYKHLNIQEGIVGACSLLPLEVFSRSVEDMKLERCDLASRLDAVPNLSQNEEITRLECLVETGRFRSAICAESTLENKDLIAEACWKLGDWSNLKSLDDPRSFNEVFACKLAGRDCVDSRTDLVKKMAINFNYEDLTNIWLLSLSPRQEREEIRVDLVHAKCMQQALEGLVGLFGKKEFGIKKLRHMRKNSNFCKQIKQFLHTFRPPIGHSLNDHCEWAKCCWVVGLKTLARDSLVKAMAFFPIGTCTWNAELRILKWSAEMELLIPKIVIANYRDLIKRSAQRQSITSKEKCAIAFAFGEYLDRVGSGSFLVTNVDQTSKGEVVWNRQLLVKEIIQQYIDAIKYDSTGKRILFTINRIFQLHWELLHSGDANQVQLANSIVQVLSVGWSEVPNWVWFVALPHLLVRVTSSADFGPLCEKIIVSVFAEYPRQASWVVMPSLLNSKQTERRQAGSKIISKANEISQYPNFQQLIAAMRLVCDSLVAVARFDSSPSTNNGSGIMKALSESKEGAKLLRNTGGLLIMPNRNQIASSSVLCCMKAAGNKYPFSSEVRIAKFIDQVHVYNTKAKPKRIGILDASEGKQYDFILKLEKKTDLRKDSRMMDFVNLVNSELPEDQLRTYSVLTLSEDTALIEFVPNLITMRKIIDESLSKQGKSVSMFLNKEVMNKLNHKSEGFPYFQSIVDTVPPMIAEWMARQFLNPKRWLEARTAFTKSQAVWSMVGHVVGLGDRHPDNILIEAHSGEVVHVDFDCIFSRGMILTIPELVPFRLTRICVSAMGVTGVEGLFRSKCEQTITLLRDKKKTLLSVLHAFIADPLIDWQGVTSYKKAKDVISAIEKKLNGFVDVGEMITAHTSTNTDEKLITYTESGLGRDRGAALSPEGQVDELIRAAVCQRNLAKMYLGWMPLF